MSRAVLTGVQAVAAMLDGKAVHRAGSRQIWRREGERFCCSDPSAKEPLFIIDDDWLVVSWPRLELVR